MNRNFIIQYETKIEDEKFVDSLLGVFRNREYALKKISDKMNSGKFVSLGGRFGELKDKDIESLIKRKTDLTEEKNDFTDCGSELLEIINEYEKGKGQV